MSVVEVGQKSDSWKAIDAVLGLGSCDGATEDVSGVFIRFDFRFVGGDLPESPKPNSERLAFVFQLRDCP